MLIEDKKTVRDPRLLSERFNPRFKKLNAKLDYIDHLKFVQGLQKKDMREMTQRIRELAILKNQRIYRAFDY